MATVSSTPRTTIETVGAPSAGPFSVGFRLFQSDALTVYVNQIERTDFTVTASYVNGYTDSASITFDTALANLDELQIDGSLAPARAQDYISTQPNLVQALNIELARVWATLSEVNMQVGRSIRALTDAQDPVAGLMASDFADLTTALAEAETAAGTATAAAAAAAASGNDAAEALAEVQAVADLLPDWQGAWVTATAYQVGDLVRQSGNVYICLIAHTAGTFATDLSSLRWEIFAEKGASGGGTGDVLAANNGSDFADKPATLANLGGQPVNANLNAESGLTGAADRVSYFTGVGAKALAVFTAFGRTLVSAVDAAAARTSLGLGNLAQLSFLERANLAADMIQTQATWEAGVGTNDTAVSPAKIAAAIAALGAGNLAPSAFGAVAAGDVVLSRFTPTGIAVTLITATIQAAGSGTLTSTFSAELGCHTVFNSGTVRIKGTTSGAGGSVANMQMRIYKNGVLQTSTAANSAFSYDLAVASGDVISFGYSLAYTTTTNGVAVSGRITNLTVCGDALRLWKY